MTWLINVDNGGTTTGFCLVNGGEVRYTKTLTTPYDLSRCLFDGLAKASARGARRLVIAVSGSDSAGGEARAKGCTPSSARRGPATVLLGNGRRPLTISAHLAESAQRVSASSQ
jgi:N-methylhydantoinase A